MLNLYTKACQMRFYALKASTFSQLSELSYEQLKEVYENCNHVYFNHTILSVGERCQNRSKIESV